MQSGPKERLSQPGAQQVSGGLTVALCLTGHPRELNLRSATRHGKGHLDNNPLSDFFDILENNDKRRDVTPQFNFG